MEYVAIAVLVGLLAWNFMLRQARARALRNYAHSIGLTYMGGGLPPAFPFNKTSVSWARSIRDAFAGDKSGQKILIFDCEFRGSGRGSSSWHQTVLAVQGPAECFGARRFDFSLTIERVDDWTLLYRPQQLMPVEEIEAHLSALS